MAKIVYSSIIPFSGYKCVNLFGVLFVRKGATMSDTDINHEEIHTAQMKELLYIFFYLIYFFEWIGRLFVNGTEAYYCISFEREAYGHQSDLDYLSTRRHYAQWRK